MARKVHGRMIHESCVDDDFSACYTFGRSNTLSFCFCGSSSVVERLLAKEKVAGSIPVCRSKKSPSLYGDGDFLIVLLMI